MGRKENIRRKIVKKSIIIKNVLLRGMFFFSLLRLEYLKHSNFLKLNTETTDRRREIKNIVFARKEKPLKVVREKKLTGIMINIREHKRENGKSNKREDLRKYEKNERK